MLNETYSAIFQTLCSFDFAAECFPLSDAVSPAFKISSSDKSLPFCWMWCLVIANDTDMPITDPRGWWLERRILHLLGDNICILIVLLLTGMYSHCLKITQNAASNIASEASNVYILSRQKFTKNAKK